VPDEPLRRPALTDNFRVGDWLVQPDLDRLSRGETLIHLRPQLTNLLLLLARHAGRPVAKDLILTEVWGSQYVGESALTRCITEIRQALGDDARQPKIIETIPKRGYRLVAPVEFLPDAVPTPDGRPASSPQSVDPGPGLQDSGPSLAEAGSGRQHFSRRARWTVLLATAAAVVVGVTLGAGDWVMRPVLSDRDTVLLADVSNTTGDRVFDDTLRLALAVNLEQAPFLRILPQETARASLVRMGRDPGERLAGSIALDVCRREGAAVVLTGSIARLGSRYAVGIEALACGTGESVGRALVEAATKERVLTALEQAATRIRRNLGESRASLRQHDVPLVRATTPSLEALRALTLGDESRDHARLEAALVSYRQATELDPGFALAWARRGAAAWNLGLRDDAIPAFRKAYALRDRVSPPEGYYIAGHYYTLVEGDPAKAIEIYRTWRQQYPGSPIPPTNLVFILAGTMGQYDAALPEAREAVRLAPYSSLSYSNLALTYLGVNRIPEARKALAEASRAGAVDWLIHRQLLNLALLDGDGVALEREIRWAEPDPQANVFTLQTRASAAMAGGRLREARRLWSAALAKSDEIGSPRHVAETRRFQAEAEALVGDPRAARVAIEASLAADRGAASLAFSAIVFALVGDGARAQKLLDEVATQPQPNLASPQVWMPVARALVGTSLGRHDEALRLLQPVVRYERGVQFRLVPLGVRAIAARSARRPADAAAAFEETLRLRAVEPSSPWLAFAQLGLARALRESGDAVGSAAAYQTFLESWKGADPDAPLLKIARRERAAITGL
jgi:eukaryotic-like serine/threonine-protein kinase